MLRLDKSLLFAVLFYGFLLPVVPLQRENRLLGLYQRRLYRVKTSPSDYRKGHR